MKSELGRVYVDKPLIGKYGTYKFYVQAQDNLGQGFVTNASVTVEVMRSSNVPPYFVVPPRDNMTIFVLEVGIMSRLKLIELSSHAIYLQTTSKTSLEKMI